MNSENILYSTNVWKSSKDCCDCYLASVEGTAELTYECIDSFNVYECQYGILLRNCTNCYYCFDCKGCTNCFLSVNLRNKQHYILNEPYSGGDYLRRIEEFQLGSSTSRGKLYKQYSDLVRTKALHRFANIERSINVSGNMIINSKNSHHVFDADKAEDTKYGIICPDVKTTMDSYHYGFACELNYETHALINAYDVMFTHLSYHNLHLQYCDTCHNSENLFGCVGVKAGKYAILNKQYSEGDCETLKKRIIEHMRETAEYGEIFPPNLSPFGYNETQGKIYMPMTKEEALKAGYKWEDLVPGTFGKGTIKYDLTDRLIVSF